MLECSVVKITLDPFGVLDRHADQRYNKTKVKSLRLYNESNTSILLIDIENLSISISDLYLAQFYKYAY